MFVHDPLLVLAGSQIGIANKQRNLNILVQVLPQHIGKAVDIAVNRNTLRLALEGRDHRIAIAHIGVDKVTQTGNCGIFIEETGAGRTFGIGNVAPEVKQLVKVTEECFFKGIEGLKAGTPLFDIGYRVQKHAESFGYGVIRSYTGHAIGKEMHEDPSVPNFGKLGTGMRLKEGMVLCIEPMIALGTWRVRILSDRWTAVTEDGKPAAHYENTVVVRKDGVEILTL